MPLDRNKLRELAKGKASIVSLPASRHKTARATRRAARPARREKVDRATSCVLRAHIDVMNGKTWVAAGSKFGRHVQEGVLDALPSRFTSCLRVLSPHVLSLHCAGGANGRAEQRLLGFGCAACADRGYFQARAQASTRTPSCCSVARIGQPDVVDSACVLHVWHGQRRASGVRDDA